MAKRKRLEVPAETVSSGLETKSAFSPRTAMPIATVAGESAGQAALEEVAREMTAAETEGRVIKRLPLAAIGLHHLCRDRMVMDPEEMAALKASLAERGQQIPIEVVKLGTGYGLISGMRRVVALKEVGETHVLALIRTPETSAAAYRAMVEENEIRSDLSFYERANIACAAVGQGVYATPREAVAGLFSHAPPAKRSKILSFVALREKLGASLSYPTAIPEKLGLALVAALEADKALASRLSKALKRAAPEDAAAERKVLERALGKSGAAAAAPPQEIAPGVKLAARKGRVVFSGAAVDEAFLEAARAWAVSHAKT